LLALQAHERFFVRKQRTCFVEREQVRVELVDDLGARLRERGMQRAEASSVLVAEGQKGLARGDLLVREAEPPGDPLDLGEVGIQAKTPSKGQVALALCTS
jgi:hypothetical protein